MKYAVAANWEMDLLDKLEGTSVKSLYGQIWNDPMGGGRMSFFIPKISIIRAAKYIGAAKRKGLGFSYLINATCFDNTEFTRRGYANIMEHLDWISSSGADTVTVSLPFLAQMIKAHFPGLKVAVSSFARIQNAHIARYWEDLGADKLILPEILGREFKTLSLIRKAVDCELELIANHLCLWHCPLDLHHRNMVSHGSQEKHPCGGFAVDSCKLSCQRAKLADPAEIIKSRWIRPEDVGEYEAVGIDCLKIVERFRSTESLMEIVNAYEKREYKGDLAKFLSVPHEGASLAPNLDLIEKMDQLDMKKIEQVLAVLREPFSDKLVIDNQKLNGFLKYFKKIDCLHMDCKQCGYCEKVAEQAIVFDETWRQEMIEAFDKAIQMILKGEVSAYHG